MWEEYAIIAERDYGDWGKRFYTCPECLYPVYKCDWSDEELEEFFYPVCDVKGLIYSK